MTTGRFLIVALVGVSVAALCLALATVLDSAILAVVGAVLVMAVFVAREGWIWHGSGRQWLVMLGAVVAVVLAAFVGQQLFG